MCFTPLGALDIARRAPSRSSSLQPCASFRSSSSDSISRMELAWRRWRRLVATCDHWPLRPQGFHGLEMFKGQCLIKALVTCPHIFLQSSLSMNWQWQVSCFWEGLCPDNIIVPSLGTAQRIGSKGNSNIYIIYHSRVPIPCRG